MTKIIIVVASAGLFPQSSRASAEVTHWGRAFPEFRQSFNGAFPGLPQSFPKARPELPQSFPELPGAPRASPELPQSSPELPGASPRASPELPQSFPKAFPELPQSFPRASPKLPQSFPRACYGHKNRKHWWWRTNPRKEPKRKRPDLGTLETPKKIQDFSPFFPHSFLGFIFAQKRQMLPTQKPKRIQEKSNSGEGLGELIPERNYRLGAMLGEVETRDPQKERTN